MQEHERKQPALSPPQRRGEAPARGTAPHGLTDTAGQAPQSPAGAAGERWVCPGRWAGSGGAGRGKAPRRKAGQAPRWGRDRAGSGAGVGRTQVPCAQRQKMVSASPRGPAFLPHTRWTSSWPASDMAGRRRPCGRAGGRGAGGCGGRVPCAGAGPGSPGGRGRAGHSCGRRGLAGRLEEPRMPKGFSPLSSSPCCFRGRRKPGGRAGGCWRECRAGSLRSAAVATVVSVAGWWGTP